LPTHDTRPTETMMPLTTLDHYFVRVKDLERSRRFYCDALGFEVMPRPALPFPGYWLGVGGKVQVHMGPDGAPAEATHYFGTTPRSARDNAGVVDHIAFQATDPDALAKRLNALGLRSRRGTSPRSSCSRSSWLIRMDCGSS
jgi:catechol 2,3-dioxygenase-like lactoylglutathione lyase family enzyme